MNTVALRLFMVIHCIHEYYSRVTHVIIDYYRTLYAMCMYIGSIGRTAEIVTTYPLPGPLASAGFRDPQALLPSMSTAGTAKLAE